MSVVRWQTFYSYCSCSAGTWMSSQTGLQAKGSLRMSYPDCVPWLELQHVPTMRCGDISSRPAMRLACLKSHPYALQALIH